MIKKSFNKIQRGFTLIELLIVIAILGVLASVVLVAVDPIEQLGRGRDSGRKSSITQLGRALQAYYTNNAAYPPIAAVPGDFMTILTQSGEIKVAPSAAGGAILATACAGGTLINNICYKLSATPDVVVYSHMESKTEQRKGTCAGVAANTWFVYSSASGRAGVVCQAAEPAAGFAGTFY